jgi:hypothetical protein
MADEKESIAFTLPVVPENFGAVLPAASLRKIDFSGLDFETARRAILEYIATYYPNEFNDFTSSNGIIMLTEIVASCVAKLALRGDILAQESTLPTALTEEAVVNHLALINQKIKRQTPASTDIEITVDRPIISDIEIEAGTSFSIQGPDNKPVVYELYKAPGDYTSRISIPAGKRGIIAFAIEGEWSSTIIANSSGGPNQRLIVEEANMLEDPIYVYVRSGSSQEEWLVVTDPIERYTANDKVVEVIFIDTRAIFRFGDNITGQSPPSGAQIEIRYRVGGGRRGRIGVSQIEQTLTLTPLPPASAPIPVLFRNIVPSRGGFDKETLEEAKRRAPRDYSLQRSIVTADDYAQAATSYSHPTYGSVKKAIATLRSSINANLTQIYALSEGYDGLPTKPSQGLKLGLITYIKDLNVNTDTIEILDGETKPVDIDLNVVINRNADASIVRDRVEAAITQYFSLDNWDLGEAFYISNFIDAISAIDGVSFVDLYSPNDNIIPTGQLGNKDDALGIGYNEIIIEGKRKTSYYYEKSPPPGGIRAGR